MIDLTFASRRYCDGITRRQALRLGGTGMLGREVAKWLAGKGATQIVLVSRREPDESIRCPSMEVR